MFSSLLELGFDSAIELRTHVDVVYFRDRDEYRRVAPKWSSGIFRREFHDYESTPIALLYGDFVQRTKETLQHELTHFFVHAHYPQAPIWLNEGLAEYFSTLEITDGVAVLGRPPKALRFWKGPWSSEVVDGEIGTKIPMSEALPVSTLLAMDLQSFEGMADADPNTPSGDKASQAMARHYASAWNLVHLLMVEPNYRARFDAYRQQLLQGTASDAAWAQTVGAIPMHALEKSYQDALVRFETTVQRAQYTPRKTGAGRVRALSDADVHVMWARLRSWDTPEERAAAHADMLEAAAHEPNHPGLAVLEAYVRDRQGQGDLLAAQAPVERALAARPDDTRLLNALGWLRLRSITHKERDLTGVLAGLDPVAAKLAPLAKTAKELDFLARYSLVRGELDAAFAYEKRATLADPSCYACFSFAASLLEAKGRIPEALQTATLAANMLPDGVQVPSITAQIAHYRRRLREKPAPAAPSSPPKPPTQ